ncbi:esterase-like activity of phytase family protein [Marinomonas sp. TI.3.20]|uniref:esterase-like activity of phytase family protein n=1 Tax=Marinomonas sp. TI.3.20 TaxID=3121296 RepID=UPI00311DF22C
MRKSYFSMLAIGCLVVSVEASAAAKEEHYPISKLDYIGEYIIPNDATVDGVTVGGLSGIDYDAKNKQWLMISDDRSDKGPDRAYLGKMTITANNVGAMTLTKMIPLLQPNGSLYPSKVAYLSDHKGVVPDFESIRFNPDTKGIRYTSEGDRSLGFSPFIRDADMDGHYLDELPVPAAFKFDPKNKARGFYDNLAFEGSSYTPDKKAYFVAMEAPLIQDGPVPSLNKGAFSRVLRYGKNNTVLGEYVYPVDSLPAAPGAGKHADNGVSEILAVDNQHLLVLERAGIQDKKGHYHDYIRIYQTDMKGATNVKGRNKLVAGQFKPMHKRLLLNLNQANLPRLDNLEGITFGPKLADGQQALVLISDNNFNATEVTQLFAFKVIPAHL